MKKQHIEYVTVPTPVVSVPQGCPALSVEVLKRRQDQTCRRMRADGLDFVLVYADREHCANFAWLVGFDPRFEEAAAILRSDGMLTMILGNENLTMPGYVGVEGATVHFPTFSLLNQPRSGVRPFDQILAECGIDGGKSVGICGWKYYAPDDGCPQEAFEVPHWIVEAVKDAVTGGVGGATGRFVNAASLFMSPVDGLRTTLEAEQIAVYEYACCLVSRTYLDFLASVRPGITERQLAMTFTCGGYPQSVHAMLSTGEKAAWGLSSPSDRSIALGDFLTSAFGLKGALIARAAFVASAEEDLPSACRSWLKVVAEPYFQTAVRWYESMHAGARGADVFSLVEAELLSGRFGWTLNPGHFIGDDEWVSSPFSDGSSAVLTSGSYLQFDLIPDPPRPQRGANMEDGFVIADESLRAQISSADPQIMKRFARRRAFLADVLGIRIAEDLLPMSDLAGFYTPFLMERNKAFVVSS